MQQIKELKNEINDVKINIELTPKNRDKKVAQVEKKLSSKTDNIKEIQDYQIDSKYYIKYFKQAYRVGR